MDIFKLSKYGINPSNISSASQASKIFNAIEAEDDKELKEKQTKQQLEAQRHRETIKLQQKSLQTQDEMLYLKSWNYNYVKKINGYGNY